MVSLLDQYEQNTSQSSGYLGGTRAVFPELVTTAGFINARLDDEIPIFKKNRINFTPTHSITHLVVSNNILTMSMVNKVLLRINLKDPDQPEEIDLSKSIGDKAYAVKLYEMFLDPNGRHLLLSLVNSETDGPFENYYLYHGLRKALPLQKLKGHVISAVGWNYKNTVEDTTSYILVGTTKALIFEMEITAPSERVFFQSTPDQYCKQVCNLGQEQLGPITGLEFHKVSVGAEQKCFIMATTPRRLYQFIGTLQNPEEPPVLHRIFAPYGEIPDRYIDIPSDLKYSCLQFHYSAARSIPKMFALMLGPGVYFGDIVYDQKKNPGSIILNPELFYYPEDKNDSNPFNQPLSLILTAFHTLVLFPDRMKAFCLLNKELIFEDVFTETYGRLLGMAKDPIQGSVWAYSEMAVYRYRIEKEERNVWEVYLKKKQYDLAKKYCETDPAKLDKVYSKEAEELYNMKDYVNSAQLYAQTHSSFEEVSLKFLHIEEEEALRVFLLSKLDRLKPSDKTQTTMITLWLIELYLNQLGVLRNAGRHQLDRYKQLLIDFHTLLKEKKVKKCVTDNRGAVYKLIANHGDENILIEFAKLMNDHERMIQYHIQHKNYAAALEVLTKQSNVELFYQFSPALMQCFPKKTVDVWITQGEKLNPTRLITALVQYDHTKDQKQGEEAIRYLEYCVDNLHNEDQAIHNYLLALYARLKPEKLMRYLNCQGQDQTSVCYDLKYALRLCSELNLTIPCVHIYTTMELYEEAVDLALKVDIELAKQNANMPEDSEELKKKLWLKIAEHVVKEEKDIKRAMEFLQECDLIKIEDILPFFNEFVTIDHFKDAICNSLQEYNQHIEGLKSEMEEATNSAADIRNEIQTFRNKFSFVKADQKCDICSYPVTSQAFYLFPCRHMFHTDCLIVEVHSHLIEKKRFRVEEIRRQLVAMGGRDDTASVSSASGVPTLSLRERLMNELDDLIASECCYCGEIMIKTIDEPFISLEEYDSVMEEWH